jgi:[ribosomal protein S5]-alanine N-acetyltransferase
MSQRARTIQHQPVLTTERLVLRPAALPDLDDLHALWNHEQVRRFLFDDRPVTRPLAASVLDDCLAHGDKGCGLWLIQHRDGPRVMGCAGLMPTTVAAALEPRLEGLLEPLVALWPRHWRQGYATEALTALCQHAFVQLRVGQLAAVNDVPNVASGRLLVRLGFAALSRVKGLNGELQTYQLLRARAT